MKRILGALAVTSLLSACTTDEPAESPATDSQATTETTEAASETTEVPTDDPDSSDPGTEPAETESGDPSDTVDASEFTLDPSSSADYPDLAGQFLPVGARVGGHDGYDRVVIDYDGSEGVLNWSASYEDAAIQDGSGFELDMAGEKFLTVWVSGVRYPTEADGEITISGLDQSDIVADVRVDSAFEGMHLVFIGVEEPVPYRVEVFDDPTRIVIDLLDD